MSGVDFVSLYNKYRLLTVAGVEDWADRANYLYSFVILLGFTILVTTKTYLFRAIACHMPTAPDGDNFKDYVESACWVLGTIPLRKTEPIPEDPKALEAIAMERRINYYQWVPLVLGLQCVLFYLPRLAWKSVSFNRLGCDLHQLMCKANQAIRADSVEIREKTIAQVARSLELLLFAHRDYRRGVTATVRRRLFQRMSFFFVSKRLGTWIVFAYLCIKLAYLANTFIQLHIMSTLLSYDHTMFQFGFKLLHNLIYESDWTETLYFPRKAFCPISVRHLGSRQNVYLGICALPINMFNEKIYIFLYIWISLVMGITMLSILVWSIRLGPKTRRRATVFRHLQMHSSGVFGVTGTESSDEKFHSNQNTVDPKLRKRMKAFVDNYLRVDGVFMIHMLTVNFGDVVTAEIVGLLWYSWIRCYSGHSEWNLLNDNISDDEFNVDAVPKSNEQMSNGLPLTNSDLEVTKRLIEPPIAEHNFVNRAS